MTEQDVLANEAEIRDQQAAAAPVVMQPAIPATTGG
jgi:hypothetical protein